MRNLQIKLGIPLELIKTCEACPEQYDVNVKGVEVGYLRLRHGIFTVNCPTVGGELVYEVLLDTSDGVFTDEDRAKHLPMALLAVSDWIIKNRQDLL